MSTYHAVTAVEKALPFCDGRDPGYASMREFWREHLSEDQRKAFDDLCDFWGAVLLKMELIDLEDLQ